MQRLRVSGCMTHINVTQLKKPPTGFPKVKPCYIHINTEDDNLLIRWPKSGRLVPVPLGARARQDFVKCNAFKLMRKCRL